ncbi:MAG: hypothetical protein ABR526_10445 [Chthoniobacterales bacterium]
MKPDLVSGSPLWQTIFVSFAVVLVLFEIARGWRLGLPRQLVRVAAVIAAYSTALLGGRLLLPLLRPLLKVPDFVISTIGGAILALVVYSVISTLGRILFKRTGQQESGIVRWIYGAAGAFVGLFFGAFLLWLLVVGIRSLGSIAEAQVNSGVPGNLPRFAERAGRAGAPAHRTVTAVPDENSLVMSLARLKKSIELGSVGDVVKQTDVLPAGIYDTLGKTGEVFSKPQNAERFLSYPGVRELADHPKILALRADPEIMRMISEGRLLELLQDDRLIEAANDPALAAQLKRLDFKGALDHSLQQSRTSPP